MKTANGFDDEDDIYLSANSTPGFSRGFSYGFRGVPTTTVSANATVVDTMINNMIGYVAKLDLTTNETIRGKADEYRDKNQPKEISYEEYINNYCTKANTDMVFRGQFKANWNLKPSFLRLNQDFRLQDYTKYTKFLKKLNNIFSVNQKINMPINSSDLKPENIHKFYDPLSWLQHHGYKTILLDWTKSPTAAIYFALENYLNDDVSEWANIVRIFILDEKKLKDALRLEESVIISPEDTTHIGKEYFFSLFEASTNAGRIYFQNAFHSISYFEDHLIPIYYLESKHPGLFKEHLVQISDVKEVFKYLKTINNTPVSLYGATDDNTIEATAMIEFYSE